MANVAGLDTDDISAQFVLVPASDRFIPIIIEAVEGLPTVEGLRTSTDGISSHIDGAPAIVFGAMEDAFVRASRSGAHIVQTMLACRGRPDAASGSGAAVSASNETVSAFVSRFGQPAASGIFTVAEFTLFALGTPAFGDIGGRFIPYLSAVGLRTRAKTLSTRLDGDAALVVRALELILIDLSRPLGYVLMTMTLTSNLPEGEADR